MSLTVSAVTLKPNETLNPGTKRWNCTKVCRGAAVGLVFGVEGPTCLGSEGSLCPGWTRGIGEPFVAFPLLSWLEHSSSVWRRWCMCWRRALFGGSVGVYDSYLHSCIWQTLSHCLHYIQGIHVIMISWVYQSNMLMQLAGVCFCAYVSAFIHAVTFDLSASRLDLNVLVLFNMVS